MRLTKKTALSIFKEELNRRIESGNWIYYNTDVTAKREAWNNYTDSLCKDGMITKRQYDTWSNPFQKGNTMLVETIANTWPQITLAAGVAVLLIAIYKDETK